MSADGHTKCMGGPSDKLLVSSDVTRGYRLEGVTKTAPRESACPSWTELTARGAWRRGTLSSTPEGPERRCGTTTMTGGHSAGRPARAW